MININLQDWINEAENDAANQVAPDNVQPQADQGQAQANNLPNQPQDQQANQQPNPENQDASQNANDDISQDPASPDMPEEKNDIKDFEVWKNKYIKESIKGDTNNLIELISQIRDRDGLQPYQKKFIEDNWNIQLIRSHVNIEKASREIRKNLREQIDRNNPATSLLNNITATLETIPLLNNVFIKLNGYSGLKGDLHRKYVAALTGSVQVGSGANSEDLIYNEREYSILISTRFNARWGDVMLGSWSLKQEDVERYLEEPEIKRLESGSPEEKDALRKRVVIESISELFETRAFFINVVGEDGTIYSLGWDIASSLRSAFAEGKLVVKIKSSESSEAMISDEGKIIPLTDLSIVYTKEGDNVDSDGGKEKEEFNFIERREGVLFLTANLKLIKESSTALQGCAFKEIPYNGNPSDLKSLSRCVYTAVDLIMRNC